MPASSLNCGELFLRRKKKASCLLLLIVVVLCKGRSTTSPHLFVAFAKVAAFSSFRRLGPSRRAVAGDTLRVFSLLILCKDMVAGQHHYHIHKKKIEVVSIDLAKRVRRAATATRGILFSLLPSSSL